MFVTADFKPVAKLLPFLIAVSHLPLALADGAQLEEVIITAQKRAENLQDVPISVQALDSSALEKNSITNLSDLRALAPGMTINTYPLAQGATLQMNIRGSQPFATDVSLDSAVAIHINGVYIARPDGINQVTAADLERVEILKGPQGTLVGRNAAAGAVNIITAKPTFDGFHFKQQVTLATRGQLTSKTSVNLPVSDTLALRASYIHVAKDEPDNGVKNNGTGPEVGTQTADAWRLDLRWKPAGNVTVDYGYDYSKTSMRDQPFQCLGPSPLTFNRPDCTKNYTGTVTSFGSLPESQIEAQGHTLTVAWDASETLTVKSITGYRKLDETFYTNMISSPGNFVYTSAVPPGFSGMPGGVLGSTLARAVALPAAANGNIVTQDQVSEEVQFLGKPTEFFNYTAGLYYFQEKGAMVRSTFSWIPNRNLGPGLGGNNNLLAWALPINFHARNTSWAIFGQFSWRPDILGRKLEIIPGIRYTRDTRDMSMQRPGSVSYMLNNPFALAGFLPGVPAGTTLTQLGPVGGAVSYGNSRSFSKSTPSLVAQYHIDDDTMVYAKLVRGYRSGGYSTNDSDPVRAAAGFAPETVTSQEIGFKGEFMDRRLRTNFALYEMKYDNQQMTIATGVGATYNSAILNAGKSTTQGFELDLAFAATERLRLGFSWAHMKLTYDQIIDPIPTSPTYGQNVASRFFRVLPKDSYTASMDYRFPSFGLPGKLDGHLDYARVDAQSGGTIDASVAPKYQLNTGYLPSPSDLVGWGLTPAYSIWNGRLALNGIPVGPNNAGDLSVALWVKNLTDKKYLSYVMGGDAFMGTGGTSFGLWGQRRTVGVDVIYRY